jgi:hypothetical protein
MGAATAKAAALYAVSAQPDVPFFEFMADRRISLSSIDSGTPAR